MEARVHFARRRRAFIVRRRGVHFDGETAENDTADMMQSMTTVEALRLCDASVHDERHCLSITLN